MNFKDMTKAELVKHLEWCEYMFKHMVEAYSKYAKEDETNRYGDWSASGSLRAYKSCLRMVQKGQDSILDEDKPVSL